MVSDARDLWRSSRGRWYAHSTRREWLYRLSPVSPVLRGCWRHQRLHCTRTCIDVCGPKGYLTVFSFATTTTGVWKLLIVVAFVIAAAAPHAFTAAATSDRALASSTTNDAKASDFALIEIVDHYRGRDGNDDASNRGVYGLCGSIGSTGTYGSTGAYSSTGTYGSLTGRHGSPPPDAPSQPPPNAPPPPVFS